ncbi:30S ribosomal protein S9 [Patescibacteria group bacterium]|nr:30S ribosomal protein S9 [Patescibacteria group bacterium]MCL5797272.1 30S ribosomal protein S9 [Patescibacteria group bacterium]
MPRKKKEEKVEVKEKDTKVKEVEGAVVAKSAKKQTFYQAVGRRKVSTARVRLYVVSSGEIEVGGVKLKKGDIVVNKRPVDKYFPGAVYQKLYQAPFATTENVGRFAVSAVIDGGGLAGQLGAFVHAASRALLLVDSDKYRPVLKNAGFLTRDPRSKERRKAGNAQKARAKKQSPKR